MIASLKAMLVGAPDVGQDQFYTQRPGGRYFEPPFIIKNPVCYGEQEQIPDAKDESLVIYLANQPSETPSMKHYFEQLYNFDTNTDALFHTSFSFPEYRIETVRKTKCHPYSTVDGKPDHDATFEYYERTLITELPLKDLEPLQINQLLLDNGIKAKRGKTIQTEVL